MKEVSEVSSGDCVGVKCQKFELNETSAFFEVEVVPVKRDKSDAK